MLAVQIPWKSNNSGQQVYEHPRPSVGPSPSSQPIVFLLGFFSNLEATSLRPFDRAVRNLKLRLDLQVLKPAVKSAIQISPSGVCCGDEMSRAGQFIENFT